MKHKRQMANMEKGKKMMNSWSFMPLAFAVNVTLHFSMYGQTIESPSSNRREFKQKR